MRLNGSPWNGGAQSVQQKSGSGAWVKLFGRRSRRTWLTRAGTRFAPMREGSWPMSMPHPHLSAQMARRNANTFEYFVQCVWPLSLRLRHLRRDASRTASQVRTWTVKLASRNIPVNMMSLRPTETLMMAVRPTRSWATILNRSLLRRLARSRRSRWSGIVAGRRCTDLPGQVRSASRRRHGAGLSIGHPLLGIVRPFYVRDDAHLSGLPAEDRPSPFA